MCRRRTKRRWRSYRTCCTPQRRGRWTSSQRLCCTVASMCARLTLRGGPPCTCVAELHIERGAATLGSIAAHLCLHLALGLPPTTPSRAHFRRLCSARSPLLQASWLWSTSCSSTKHPSTPRTASARHRSPMLLPRGTRPVLRRCAMQVVVYSGVILRPRASYARRCDRAMPRT